MKKPKEKGKSKEKEDKPSKRQKIADSESSILYLVEEEHHTGKNVKTGEIREALKKIKTNSNRFRWKMSTSGRE